MVSSMLSGSCLVISVVGVVVLLLLGLAYEKHAHVVMGTKEDPEDGHAVAIQLWGAAAVYAVFAFLSGSHMMYNQRYNRPGAVRI